MALISPVTGRPVEADLHIESSDRPVLAATAYPFSAFDPPPPPRFDDATGVPAPPAALLFGPGLLLRPALLSDLCPRW